MKTLKDIIERCHKRHQQTLQQRKTVVTPALYKSIPYKIKVYCARTYPVMLDDLELSNISFMPIGRAPDNNRGPRDFGGTRFLRRQKMESWRFRRWCESWGIQIYTGMPSEDNGKFWHDLHFTYQAICAAPDAVLACIQTIINSVPNPLLTLLKSGGLRFTCRIPDYLHPDTEDANPYIYKQTATSDNSHHPEVYLVILGKNRYSRWDSRYEILSGNLLEPPIITKEVLFNPLDMLREVLHEPDLSHKKLQSTLSKTYPVDLPSFDSQNLNLAKDALLKREFSYLQKDDEFYYWILPDSKRNSETYVSVWEDSETVWIRADTNESGLPTRSTPITDIWNDTGIKQSISTSNFPVTQKTIAVREGRLSPLAIKRSSPILQKQTPTKKVYKTHEENSEQIQRAFEKNTQIVGFVPETAVDTNKYVESYLLNGGFTCLNTSEGHLTDIIEQRYEELGLHSFARWKFKMHNWKQVQHIPADIRMANPFQGNNVCEDPERFRALAKKGGEPRVSICPKCPVYSTCQEHGYLAQSTKMQSVKAQVTNNRQLFTNPMKADSLAQILKQDDEAERLCIIDDSRSKIDLLYIRCALPFNILNEWMDNWKGHALGRFATALIYAINPDSRIIGNPITRVRAAVQAFKSAEKELVQQMCQVNVQGKVIKHGKVDAETDEELASMSIAFNCGTTAYIPLDDNTAEKLKEKQLPFIHHNPVSLNETVSIPMKMSKAIELGILDTSTVGNIEQFPSVCQNPNWTFWHQLKSFFEHYNRDADAPMAFDSDQVEFWHPPILNPSVKRLLFISPVLSEQHLRKMFPNQEVEWIPTEPSAWLKNNHVFQIRTDTYQLRSILNYDSDWDSLSLSKMGERFFVGIRAEIEKDTNVTHAIVTYNNVIRYLSDIADRENVCFVSGFKDLFWTDTTQEIPQVLWIIGTPHWSQQINWRRAQMLFGNDEIPLNYGDIINIHDNKDKRIREIYEQHPISLLKQIVGWMGLHINDGKKVLLLTSIRLPDITDRPETLLFDWEDFEVAGGLDTLTEVIATRERFEEEYSKLTAETRRMEVERVLGCSTRKANRFLKKLRGGNIPRISLREQILSLLEDGEKRASEFVNATGNHRQTIAKELKRLMDLGEIVRIRRGVYKLPEA